MYSFKDFLQFLWLRKLSILVLTFCCVVFGCVGFVFLEGFQYTSQVSFLLPVIENEEEDPEVENAMITSNIKLIETYKEIVKSDSMLKQLKKDSPELSEGEILKALTITSSFNSQMFTVQVTGNSPEQSIKIAQSLSDNYPQIVANNQLPRKAFSLSSGSFEALRTPSFSKLVLCACLISFIISSSYSFIWSQLYERKFIQNPAEVKPLLGVEIISTVDFYER